MRHNTLKGYKQEVYGFILVGTVLGKEEQKAIFRAIGFICPINE